MFKKEIKTKKEKNFNERYVCIIVIKLPKKRHNTKQRNLIFLEKDIEAAMHVLFKRK